MRLSLHVSMRGYCSQSFQRYVLMIESLVNERFFSEFIAKTIGIRAGTVDFKLMLKLRIKHNIKCDG